MTTILCIILILLVIYMADDQQRCYKNATENINKLEDIIREKNIEINELKNKLNTNDNKEGNRKNRKIWTRKPLEGSLQK